ncbi:hypothetical protein OC845_006238 [Tilletia horrida]|nr:hypothetical protein OC845_006238 [Tilletia horrida]
MLIKKLHHEHTPRAGGFNIAPEDLSGTGPSRASDERAQRLYFSQQQQRTRARAAPYSPHGSTPAPRHHSEEPSHPSSSSRRSVSSRLVSCPEPIVLFSRASSAVYDGSSTSGSSSKHARRPSPSSSEHTEAGPSHKRRRLLASGSWLQLPESIARQRPMQDMSNTCAGSKFRLSGFGDSEGTARIEYESFPSEASQVASTVMVERNGSYPHPSSNPSPLPDTVPQGASHHRTQPHSNSASASAAQATSTSSMVTAAQRLLETSLRHQPGQFAKRKLAKARETRGASQQGGSDFSST